LHTQSVSNALDHPVERMSVDVLQEAFWRSFTFYTGNEALCGADVSVISPRRRNERDCWLGRRLRATGTYGSPRWRFWSEQQFS